MVSKYSYASQYSKTKEIKVFEKKIDFVRVTVFTRISAAVFFFFFSVFVSPVRIFVGGAYLKGSYHKEKTF